MNWRNAGILALVLFVPIILILLFRTGTTRLKVLPMLGDKVYVNGDSLDYTVDFGKLIQLPDSFEGKHILLYLSEEEGGILSEKAHEHILELANRLLKARKHPTDQVRDIAIISVSGGPFSHERPYTWHQFTTQSDVNAFVNSELKGGFGLAESSPVKDHMIFLIDKDGRPRGGYFAAHGKFDRDIMGEMVVLRTEYGQQ